MPGGPIREFFLGFEAIGPLTKKELRKLILNITNDIVLFVKANNDVHEYIYEKPFSEKNIHIAIYNHDKQRMEVYYPNISNVQVLRGTLIFRSYDDEDHIKLKIQSTETLSEALEILKSEKMIVPK